MNPLYIDATLHHMRFCQEKAAQQALKESEVRRVVARDNAQRRFRLAQIGFAAWRSS